MEIWTTKYALQGWMRSLYFNLFIRKPEQRDFFPMDLVTPNDTEDLNELSYLGKVIGDYRKHSILERYGLDLMQYLGLPKYLSEAIALDSRLETIEQNKKLKALPGNGTGN